jgi:hypothetical protein
MSPVPLLRTIGRERGGAYDPHSAGPLKSRTSRGFSVHHRRVWTAADIEIILDDDLTDDPVVTAHILTPAGELLVMAEVEVRNRELVLRGLHMHGVTLGPNEVGWPRLRQLAHAVMERVDVDAIVIEGAVRTSGARRGHVPRVLRFTRHVSTAG